MIHCTVLFFEKFSQKIGRVFNKRLSFSQLLTGRAKFKLGRTAKHFNRLLTTERRATGPNLRAAVRASESLKTQAAESRSVPSRQAGNPRLKAREFFRNTTTKRSETSNDPSAGSPTETLLRLLLPLNAQVWESSKATIEIKNLERPRPNTSLKRSIGSSDGRCVQRAGT